MTSTKELIETISSPVLCEAVRRILANHGGNPVMDRASIAELRRIVLQVDRNGENSDCTSSGDPRRQAYLISRLRSELLEMWNEDPDAPRSSGFAELLLSLERITPPVPVPPLPGSFNDHLTSTHARELVVELAHDLRSPLTSILFLSETLRHGQSGAVNELQHQQLGIIYSAALSLASMAGDVVELARSGSRLVEKQPTAFSVSEMFASICDLIRPMVENKDLVLHTLPPTIDQRLGFPVALSRVLLNLSTNAIKFTERGTVEITARELGRGKVEFSVRDSGRGIEPEAIDHLFEPFRPRPEQEKLGFSGTGLGLSICRRLVMAMGGMLEFESTPGWGTRFFFTVRLPPVERDRAGGYHT